MNSFAPVGPSLIDVFPDEHDGYPEELAAEDSHDTLVEAAAEASREFPKHLWVEPKDWAKVAAENDRHGTWAIHNLDRFTNQGAGNGGPSTHECTCHALRACMESTRNRQRAIKLGPPVAGKRLEISAKSASVWLSPMSVYSEANPRIRGGASTRGVMEIARRRGMLPETIQPRDYGFRHALVGTQGKGGINQSRGDWVPLSKFPAGWQDTARHFRPLEIIIPDSWEQIVCCVLGGPEGRGYAVGVGRNGHAIPYVLANIGQQLLGYIDSYDVIRWDSFRTVRSAVGSAYCIASVTTPDDWDHPAI
jgi:hypothetical protein